MHDQLPEHTLPSVIYILSEKRLHVKSFGKHKKRHTLMVNYLVNNNNKGSARGHMLGCCAYYTSSRGQTPKLCGFVEIKLGGRKLGKRVDGRGKGSCSTHVHTE
jgi:hypothetical protein